MRTVCRLACHLTAIAICIVARAWATDSEDVTKRIGNPATAGQLLLLEDFNAITWPDNPSPEQRVGLPPERPGVPLPLRWCPPGRFESPNQNAATGANKAGKRVTVQLTTGFWMGQHEVTRGEWRAVMGTEPWNFPKLGPSGPDDDRLPAVGVVYAEVEEFVRRVNATELSQGRLPRGWNFRLPTEAEWEYACRAGTYTAYSFGDDASAVTDYGWIQANCTAPDHLHAHAVEMKPANALGLHDMHGNAWEWCMDWFSLNRPSGTDPLQTRPTTMRVRRGGSWRFRAHCARSDHRDGRAPDFRSDAQGFRVVLAQGTPN